MKLFVAFLAFALAAVVALTTDNSMIEKNEAVRHIVVFKYAEDATPEQIGEVTAAFKALKDKIPGIIGFEYGVNNSPEGLDQGFTHIYLLTFENEAARDTYLPHPDHAAFGDILRSSGIFEGAFVVDYTIHE